MRKMVQPIIIGLMLVGAACVCLQGSCVPLLAGGDIRHYCGERHFAPKSNGEICEEPV